MVSVSFPTTSPTDKNLDPYEATTREDINQGTKDASIVQATSSYVLPAPSTNAFRTDEDGDILGISPIPTGKTTAEEIPLNVYKDGIGMKLVAYYVTKNFPSLTAFLGT